MCAEAKRLFAEALINLRDFQFSDAEVNEMVAPEDRHGSPKIEVLGITWDTMEDILAVETKPFLANPLNKRSLLRFIEGHFDPPEYLAPAISTLKILLQGITEECPSWDAEACHQRRMEWEAVRTSWKSQRFVIPRLLPHRSLELHALVDSSTKAYAAVTPKAMMAQPFYFAKSQLCPVKGDCPIAGTQPQPSVHVLPT
ncbi:unnamed protein product [Toxocara canis]|uniref:Peptidase_M13_N domain-containing protein n=1 Tax=Toxocara canis TaxID=6265 RepID=A0A183UX89_TOXCA|nr:unnamed protein product [Toxocara canis]